MHMPERADEEQDGIISKCIRAERGEERQSYRSLQRGENQGGETKRCHNIKTADGGIHIPL